MKPLTLEVPVLPRIRKYLRVHYPNRIEPAPHDPRLAQLWAMLQTDRTKLREYADQRIGVPPDSIIVSLSQYHPSRSGVRQPLNAREIRMANLLLDSFLYGEFAQLARGLVWSGGTPGRAARQFCDRYDLSERDLSEETLKRVWNRQNNAEQNHLVGFGDELINRLTLC